MQEKLINRVKLMLASAMLLSVAAMPAAAEGLLDRVKQAHVLTMATSDDPPLAFQKDGKPAGILVDILEVFLKKAGIDAEIKVQLMPFSSVIPTLTSGRADISEVMYMTDARKKVVSFTHGILYNPEALLVKPGNPTKIHQLNDLCGHTTGTYQGTAYIAMLKDQNAKCPADKQIDVRLYPSIQDVFNEFSTGRLESAILDGTLSLRAIKENPGLNFEAVSDYIPPHKAETLAGFALQQSDADTIEKFNQYYDEMLKDGSAATIFEKWGLAPAKTFLEL